MIMVAIPIVNDDSSDGGYDVGDGVNSGSDTSECS